MTGLLGWLFEPFRKVLEYIITFLLNIIWKPIELFMDFLGDKLFRQIRTGSFAGEQIPVEFTKSREWWDYLVNSVSQAEGIAKVFMIPLAIAGFTKAALSYIMEMFQNAVSRDINRMNQDNFIPGDAAVRTFWSGRLSGANYLSLMQDLGFSWSAADILEESMRQNLELGVLFDARRRGILDDRGLTERLWAHGIRPVDIQILKQLIPVIPPVQDIITMAVREAFSPEIAQRFGQYEDFPAEVERYAQMQGLSPEWARRYWAAHWNLPSLQMG